MNGDMNAGVQAFLPGIKIRVRSLDNALKYNDHRLAANGGPPVSIRLLAATIKYKNASRSKVTLRSRVHIRHAELRRFTRRDHELERLIFKVGFQCGGFRFISLRRNGWISHNQCAHSILGHLDAMGVKYELH